MDMEIFSALAEFHVVVWVREQANSVVYGIQAILRFAIQSSVENLF